MADTTALRGFGIAAGAGALALAVACGPLEDMTGRLFEGRTPRERYELRLEQAGLGETALVRAWRGAAERALREAPSVPASHLEHGYLPPAEPAALAFRVRARRGQELTFSVELAGDSTTLVFLEAWEVVPDTGFAVRRVASADSGARVLRMEPRRDAELILRAQPELLGGGRITVRLDLAPTLAFPVSRAGERDVGSGWGAPRDGGAREHHGIDIFAPRGTPALAAAPAVVSRVGESARGGRVVWLRDARGYALYYAHLDSQAVREGMVLAPGDTVGFVGNTGNARSTPPHLHFGVYRRGEGPLDPWWFVHRPRAEIPRLAVDTTRLGGRVRTAGPVAELLEAPESRAGVRAELARHTVVDVLAGVGGWYRVRLPDGTTGYLPARQAEAVGGAVGVAALAAAGPVLARPDPSSPPSGVVWEAAAGDTLPVLGRFREFALVRGADGNEGWLRTEGPVARQESQLRGDRAAGRQRGR